MNATPELEFKTVFAYAVALYPNHGSHEASLPAYWGFLKRYPLPVLREAFKRACNSSPQFFPSAVRVRECAEAAAKTKSLPTAPVSRQIEEPREYVPPIEAGAEKWISEATTPCEQLARVWQVESKAKGWDRGVEMPIEDGKRRLRELSATFEKQQAAAETRRQEQRRSNRASTSGEPRTGSASASTSGGSSASPPSEESSAQAAEQSAGGSW